MKTLGLERWSDGSKKRILKKNAPLNDYLQIKQHQDVLLVSAIACD